jgi:hypothetical protein
VDFSRLQRYELVGVISSLLLAISLFLPWYSLSHTQTRIDQTQSGGDPWVCGVGHYSCSAWDTFPINRFLFLAAAAAPIILAYLVVRGERGKYPTGEFTMTVGLAVIVLVGFNGLLAKPGGDPQFGIGLSIGYFVALFAGLLMAGAGAGRSLESGGGAQRKPPATF